MKSPMTIMALLLCVMLICSCSLFSRNGKKGSYKADAITMSIKGDPYLNLYQDRSHPVYLCIYQLKEPNWFIQSVAEDGGIANLMTCGRLDPSVAFARRLVVQPGQALVENGDMAEGTRYLGIVAGYYDLRKENVVRLCEIGKSHFSMSLELGPREIQNIKVK